MTNPTHNMIFRRSLGKRLKELRKNHGFTQLEFAKNVPLSYKFYQRLEGSHPPSLNIETIQKITSVFKLSLSEFFDSEIFEAKQSTHPGEKIL